MCMCTNVLNGRRKPSNFKSAWKSFLRSMHTSHMVLANALLLRWPSGVRPNIAFSPKRSPHCASMMGTSLTQIETVPKRTMYSASGYSPWKREEQWGALRSSQEQWGATVKSCEGLRAVGTSRKHKGLEQKISGGQSRAEGTSGEQSGAVGSSQIFPSECGAVNSVPTARMCFIPSYTMVLPDCRAMETNKRHKPHLAGNLHAFSLVLRVETHADFVARSRIHALEEHAHVHYITEKLHPNFVR